jgi:hypothetical protein
VCSCAAARYALFDCACYFEMHLSSSEIKTTSSHRAGLRQLEERSLDKMKRSKFTSLQLTN